MPYAILLFDLLLLLAIGALTMALLIVERRSVRGLVRYLRRLLGRRRAGLLLGGPFWPLRLSLLGHAR